jgi:hypothetical protein
MQQLVVAPNQLAINLIVNLLGRAHGGLDVEDLDVLPVLLQQRHQEVDGELHIKDDLSGVHGHVSDGDGHAHDLLHLELDGSLLGINLLLHVVGLVKKGGKFTGLGQTRTQDTGDLLEDRTGGQESVVLLGELLDDLLVLVELLQVLDGHSVDADGVGLFAVALGTKNAYRKVGLGDHGKSEGARETFVTLGIVVLKGDLQLHGLDEVTLLSLDILLSQGDSFTIRIVKDILNRLGQ